MSSIETDADVNIKLNAEDNASLVIDESTKRINKSFNDMRVQQRQATREFEVNNRVLTQGGRVLNSLGRIVSRTIAIYNTFQLHQLRLAQATDRTRESTEDLNEAFLEFGEGRETQGIRERLEKEMKELKRIQDESALIIGLIGLQAVTMVGTVVSRVLPQILRFKVALKGVGASPAGLGGASAGTGLASKVSSAFNKIPKAGIPLVGAGLFASELLGGQTVSAPLADAQGNEIADPNDISNESGIDAIGRTVGDVITIINNIFSPSSQETVDEIADNTRQSLPFGNTSQ